MFYQVCKYVMRQRRGIRAAAAHILQHDGQGVWRAFVIDKSDDAESIKRLHHPMLAGIDLNSRFETEPGMKDVEKLRDFIGKIRE